MAVATQVYISTCRQLVDASDQHWIEHQFDLALLDPPTPMFGTCDFCPYSEKRRELHIVDFKYGAGVWVNAKSNSQLKYYAVGAVLMINKPIARISMTVVQPRFAKGDPVRSTTISVVELAEWVDRADGPRPAALESDAPRVAWRLVPVLRS